MRVPVIMGFELRRAIHSQCTRFGSKKMETNQELKLLGSVDSFMNAYYGYDGEMQFYHCLHCGTNTYCGQTLFQCPQIHDNALSVSSSANGSHVFVFLCLFIPVCTLE